jgi:hypothetical protein
VTGTHVDVVQEMITLFFKANKSSLSIDIVTREALLLI